MLFIIDKDHNYTIIESPNLIIFRTHTLFFFTILTKYIYRLVADLKQYITSCKIYILYLEWVQIVKSLWKAYNIHRLYKIENKNKKYQLLSGVK